MSRPGRTHRCTAGTSASLPLWPLAVAVVLFGASACRSKPGAFVRIQAARIALAHVDVVDGTGAPPTTNQTVLIEADRITHVGSADTMSIPADFEVLNLRGYTVIPGLVGMHDHLFHAVAGGRGYVGLPRSLAHLYLSAGVTTIRTAGTFNLEGDTNTKRAIDDGRDVGPRIHLTSDYIGRTSDLASLVRRIDGLADAGVTSLKVYTDARRDELAAAIGAAHRRGLTVTGHLCAVGFRQAAALGIDNLEHGLVVDSEFNSRRIPGQFPDWASTIVELAGMHVDADPIQETIRQLVERGVAVTSTLAVFESFARPDSTDRRIEPILTRTARRQQEAAREQYSANQELTRTWERALRLEMEFERAFVRAGGLLMAGADPTGWGAVAAGLGDQRNVELLVEAGFTVAEAIQIASANGARFLGQADDIGALMPGRRADLAILRGSLTSDIHTIRNVEIVFKGGVGFDAGRLMHA